MKLMYDRCDISFEQELSEGVEKKYKIKGIFSSPGKLNKNGRIYPTNIWESEVQKYQEILKSGHPNCLMELEHPPRSNVDMMEAVAKMEKLYFENGYVMGEAVLLDNPKANQLKTLIDNGIKMSVSSRGLGNVKNGLVESFKLITFDIIPNLAQSDMNAEMFGIVEGVLQDKSFLITESGEIKEVKDDIENKDIKEITENVEVKKVLSEEDKKILAKEFMGKFSEILSKSNVNESLVFSAKNKTPLDLLDSAVKSIKGMIENLNDIKEIKDFNSAKKEAKILADKVEELYNRYSK